ncbi:MAG: exonuclease domain-containing protein [Clostridia bacterium]|nr:exonuclease domain-containing protein [Clostridia bacterium]
MSNLFSPEINKDTSFIIFDLEWNQPYSSINYPFDTHKFNGEIIEIGAVKMKFNDSMELVVTDKLSLDIKPEYYRTLHFQVKKITHKTDEDLKKGISFKEGYRQLIDLCDNNSILVTWGNGDIDMLKLNLELFGCDTTIGVSYLDLQPMFSVFTEKVYAQHSVEFAVDFFNIDKSVDFHSAYADAYYTSMIMRRLFADYGCDFVSKECAGATIDPDMPRSFTRMTVPDKNLMHAYEDKQKWNRLCPVCQKKNKTVISSFRIQKSAYALYECSEHGRFYIRTKVKKNKEGLYYGAIVKRMCTTQDYMLIKNKKKEYDIYGSDGKPPCLNEGTKIDNVKCEEK